MKRGTDNKIRRQSVIHFQMPSDVCLNEWRNLLIHLIQEIFDVLTHRHRYTSLTFFFFFLTALGDAEYSVDMQRQHSVLFDARIYNLHSFEV